MLRWLVLVLGLGCGLAKENIEVFDAKLRWGRLENGITYYVRSNGKPENRAELRLVVNAGSVLEDEDQLGFAHFLEHMAFNGTASFPKLQLIDYLESIGMKFGADINAFTSMDMTGYLLQLPAETEHLDKGLLILSEWAREIRLEAEEMDKERGVVLEEWRRGRGAGQRVLEKQLPILLNQSRYAQRLPGGDPEVLESGTLQALKRFYRDWYRPDLMSVVAVGDFDAATMVEKIEQRFAKMAMPEQVRAREQFEVPPHEKTLFAIASDKELSRARVSIAFKHPPKTRKTLGDVRRELVEQMFYGMFNQRLYERTREAQPPFVSGYASDLGFVRTLGGFSLGATAEPDRVTHALLALLQEAERVRRYGFTQEELSRQKKDVMRSMERTYAEREKIDSAAFASAYMSHSQEGGPILGIEKRFELYKQWVPAVSLEQVNALVGRWVRSENRVVMASLPEKPGLALPTESDATFRVSMANGAAPICCRGLRTV